MNHVTLSMKHADDYVELHAALSYQGFEGSGYCFLDPGALEKNALQFALFPIPNDGSACIEGGYFDQDMVHLAQTHLHLSVRQKDHLGNLNFQVKLAKPSDAYASTFEAQLTCVVPISYEISKSISEAVIALLQKSNSEYIIQL